MHVPEIIEVKNHLDDLTKRELIAEWELPYENILTRRSAAIFFLTPSASVDEEIIWKELSKYEDFCFRPNSEKKLSQLKFRITFNKEERKNIPAN